MSAQEESMDSRCGQRSYNTLRGIQTDLFEVELNYSTADDYDAENKLNNWVTRCVYRAFGLPYYVPNTTFSYRNCRIEYIEDNLLFSIIRTEKDSEGFPTGVLYDVALNMSSYLKQYYGADDINLLKKHLSYTPTDFDEISEGLYQDILSWCRNVPLVFKGASAQSSRKLKK
jgi:hypothetical protein